VDLPPGGAGAARGEIHGAHAWAKGAVAFSAHARFIRPALVDGVPGLIFAPGGHLTRALRLGFKDGRIAEVDILSDPARLRDLEVAILDG
jgi:RNA polymerase sigma-70 factor (ECF subfamily)